MVRTRSASYSSPTTSTGFDLPLDAPPSPPSSATQTPTRMRRHSLAGSRSPSPPFDLSPPTLSTCFLSEPVQAGPTVPAPPPVRSSGLPGFQSVVSPLVYFDGYPYASSAYSPPAWEQGHALSPQPPLEAGWQVDPFLAGFCPPQLAFPWPTHGTYEPATTFYPISSRTPPSFSPDLGYVPPTPPVGFSPPSFHIFSPPPVPFQPAYYPSAVPFPPLPSPPLGFGFPAPPPPPFLPHQAFPQTPLPFPSPPIAAAPAPPALSTTGKTASQLLDDGEPFWSTGTCKFFDVEKGFGFIVDDHSQEIKLDVFAHYTGVDQKRGFRCLAPGERVEYVLTKLSNGKLQAFRIKGENGVPLQGLTNQAQAAAFDKAVAKAQDGGACPQIGAAVKERALAGPRV